MRKDVEHPVVGIFDDLNGPAAVARLLGVKSSTASEMKRRKSIPMRYWSNIISALHQKGIQIDEATLVRMHLGTKDSSVEQSGVTH